MGRAALWLALAGCSDFALEKVAEPQEEGTRILTATPDLVEFGVLGAGATAAETVTLRSTGTLAVSIASLQVSGSSAYTIAWPETDDLLEPDEELDVVVTYVPVSHDDQASLVAESDAVDPRLVVAILGAGTWPAIAVDPSSVYVETSYELPVEEVVLVESVGTADLVVSDMVVEGASFSAEADLPFTLAPGETAPITVTYTPIEEGETAIGKLWLTTNTPDGYAIVPLEGRDVQPCIGLGEAWDRGFLDAHTQGDGLTFEVENLSGDTDVCIDDWYVWLSEGSQDLGAGDMDGDAGGTYPAGSLTLAAGSSIEFDASGSRGPAWWCMEQTQYTSPNQDYDFTGARVPEPLLSSMRGSDQGSVWDWMAANPVVIAGRWTNYVEVSEGGGSAPVSLRILNMGGQSAVAEVRETLPEGWSMTAASPPPAWEETDDNGGTVYVWQVSLDARVETDLYSPTGYDEETLTYTIGVPPCRGRQVLTPMETSWEDGDGVARTDTANPLVVRCTSE